MTSAADILARWNDLASLANGIIPNTLSLEPNPDEITATAEDLRLLARHVDALVKAYADHFTQHTGHKIDRQYTDDQLSGALEGSLLYEFESAAEDIQQEMMEAAQ